MWGSLGRIISFVLSFFFFFFLGGGNVTNRIKKTEQTVLDGCVEGLGLCWNAFSKRTASYIMSQNRYRYQKFYLLDVIGNRVCMCIILYAVYVACVLCVGILCKYSMYVFHVMYAFHVRIPCIDSILPSGPNQLKQKTMFFLCENAWKLCQKMRLNVLIICLIEGWQQALILMGKQTKYWP